ncbi:tyrosine-type recombinase/integrase [Actinomadura oligospora]|uniref:tyrosine-type recombinase/integrase n=1 Tax=Actinomadura oligospora TaxID=111804 RepID=UPI001B80AE7F|nr:tyrosine-type recombinase/integrase [Actinomadura oligospora]
MARNEPAKRKPNGRSSIFFSEADGKWHGWVTMGVKSDGSPDRRHRIGKDEAEVTEKVRVLERQRDAGKTRKPGKAPTVTEWMTTYLETICPLLVASGKLAPRTLDDYRSKARLWIVPLLGMHRLDRLLPEHMEAAYAQMYAAGLSSSTVLKIHRILSRALKIAVRRELLGRNVATLIDSPEPADFEPKPFALEDARRILKAAEGRRNSARWSVALALGLRQGEVIGLRWEYVDLETGEIRPWFQLNKAAWRHGCSDPHACGEQWHKPRCRKNCRVHRHEPGCPKDCARSGHRCPKRPCPKDCTGHAHRCPQRQGGEAVFRRRKGKRKPILICPPELLPQLREHRDRQRAERARMGDAWEEWGLIFCQPNGRPLDRTEDWKAWKALLQRAGVHDGRLHDARHTAGSLLAAQNVHIRVIQDILGHARVTTTQRYVTPPQELVQDAGQRMGGALWGTPEKPNRN